MNFWSSCLHLPYYRFVHINLPSPLLHQQFLVSTKEIRRHLVMSFKRRLGLARWPSG